MKYFLIITFALFATIACEQEELIVEKSSKKTTHEQLINAGSFKKIDSYTEWEDFKDGKDSLKKKSVSQIETMWDVLMTLEDLVSDSTKKDEYNAFVGRYSNILKQTEDGDYDLITNVPLIAQNFNSDGILQIEDYIYVLEKDSLFKYKSQDGRIIPVSVFGRSTESNSLKSTTVTKTGPWQSNDVWYQFSSKYKVKVWIFLEQNGDLGAAHGARSKYYKKVCLVGVKTRKTIC